MVTMAVEVITWYFPWYLPPPSWNTYSTETFRWSDTYSIKYPHGKQRSEEILLIFELHFYNMKAFMKDQSKHPKLGFCCSPLQQQWQNESWRVRNPAIHQVWCAERHCARRCWTYCWTANETTTDEDFFPEIYNMSLKITVSLCLNSTLSDQSVPADD